MRTKPASTTAIARSDRDSIFVRDVNLVDDLIGQVSFTEMFLLQLTGKRPPPAHVKILDAVLVTLMEHGLTPSVIASRLIYHSSPDALQSAVAAGILGVGTTFIGTMEGCASLLEEILAAPEGPQARARDIAKRHQAVGKAVHGFGHPHHRPDDPRSPRMLALVEANGLPGRYVAALETLSREVDGVYGRHLTINATGASAALLGEIGIPQKVMRGVACVSRSAGLVGHILEESRNPSAAFIWEMVDEAVPYSEVVRQI